MEHYKFYFKFLSLLTSVRVIDAHESPSTIMANIASTWNLTARAT